MWTHEAIVVRNLRVTLAIEQLPIESRGSVAAAVAWLVMQSAVVDDAPHDAIWRSLVEDVFGPHLTFTVDHHDPDALSSVFWSEAVQHATAAFIRVNALEESIRQSLVILQDGGTAPVFQ